MDLIDLKKDPQPIDSNEMYDEPMYSYGLCISLGREELEKLGIEKLPEAGGEMMIKAIAYVKTVRESKEQDGVEQNVELQITAMGIEPFDKSGDQAEGLYGKKAATAPPKAEPAAKQATYLAQEVIMAEKTADNFGYGNMSAEYRMKYKKMLEAHDKKEKEKKKNKTKQEEFANKLYGATNK